MLASIPSSQYLDIISFVCIAIASLYSIPFSSIIFNIIIGYKTDGQDQNLGLGLGTGLAYRSRNGMGFDQAQASE